MSNVADVKAPFTSDIEQRIEGLLDSVASHFDSEEPECEWLYPDPLPGEVEPSIEDVFSSRILVVDDEVVNAKLARKYLSGYGWNNVAIETNPLEVLPGLRQEPADLVLLDVVMPELTGPEILTAMRQDRALRSVPVIVVTTEASRETRMDMLSRGATDFLSKPVDPAEVMTRIRNSLVADVYRRNWQQYATQLEDTVRGRTVELVRSQYELVRCLARAAEFRDDDTGHHVLRVGRLAELIARELGLDDAFCGMIYHAAQLHDVGKIGIPDSILLKPGRLTESEFATMREHCGYGTGILGVESHDGATDSEHSDTGEQLWHSHAFLRTWFQRLASSPLTRMASTIALTHHEKWDGSGYPLGLAGDDIPIEGRITAVADVFDALSSRRPYKPAFSFDRCFEILQEGRGQHFDPRVVDAFLARSDDAIRIRTRFAD